MFQFYIQQGKDYILLFTFFAEENGGGCGCYMLLSYSLPFKHHSIPFLWILTYFPHHRLKWSYFLFCIFMFRERNGGCTRSLMSMMVNDGDIHHLLKRKIFLLCYIHLHWSNVITIRATSMLSFSKYMVEHESFNAVTRSFSMGLVLCSANLFACI